jgi:hypothetical protein
MKRATRTVLVILALLATGGLCFRAGIEVASEVSLRNALLDAAENVWVLERIRSVSCPMISGKEREWMDLMIRSKEGLLLHPEYLKRIEADPMVRNLRERTAKLRSERRPEASPEVNH